MFQCSTIVTFQIQNQMQKVKIQMTSFMNKTSAAWVFRIHTVGAQKSNTVVILCGLIHIYNLSPQACRPWASAVSYISQTTCALDTTIN